MAMNWKWVQQVSVAIVLEKCPVQTPGWGRTDWITLAQDSDRFRAVVNAEMNLRVP